MTPSNLEDALRENLDFRRQLMIEVAKAEGPIPLAQDKQVVEVWEG
jgi:hypothetical protein